MQAFHFPTDFMGFFAFGVCFRLFCLYHGTIGFHRGFGSSMASG
jgi:hypothetical protein